MGEYTRNIKNNELIVSSEIESVVKESNVAKAIKELLLGIDEVKLFGYMSENTLMKIFEELAIRELVKGTTIVEHDKDFFKLTFSKEGLDMKKGDLVFVERLHSGTDKKRDKKDDIV